MSADTTRRKLLGSVGTAGLLGLSGCLGATPVVNNRSEERETIPLEDAASIAIVSEIGRISVAGADRDDVGLEIVKESDSVRTDLEELTLETELADGRLELRSEWDGSEGWLASRPSMEVDAEIPREVALERIETSTGRITVRDVAGDLHADADTGRVDIAGVDGTVSAEASTGRVEIRDAERLGDVSTSTGRINVEVPAIDGETTISASTGRVTAAVSEAVDADLRVETNTGRIDVDDLPLEDVTRSEEQVTGRLGDGGPQLRVETDIGRITVEPLE
ncbi:DUF4097 family beta strand repeat protein [Haloterrigena sp. SYSU A558-1]|uniref:DUF4097 family beta strand repeat protein n=1 Tax=Haloterrigena gelatinilytica TaxID=2741724 RepID=A0A8J8K9X8_9EURY|nr:DUF4097 family beta strand repeat-containing protein [Haloterrigena gelatinilytica]NUB89620.1 DUF4097 family beta strand repeat protein [Haloterrigena gelatinilytica]NUC74550.1 DUF4097 family beta strand repeat protein [Haloterrigena gelatinilytica]